MPDFVRLATAPYLQWDYATAKKAVDDALPKNYDVLSAYGERSDHWQNGDAWTGPGTGKGNKKIENQFAPDDAIGDALNNVVNAFNEAQIDLVPIDTTLDMRNLPEELKRLIAEGKELLTDWWDERRMQEHIHNRLRLATWAGRACIRLWIPPRFLMSDGTDVQFVPTEDIGAAMRYIHVSLPDPKTCAIVTDPVTADSCAIFLDKEVVTVAGQKKEIERAELMFLDPARIDDNESEMVLRVVYSDERTPSSVRLKIGGHLMSAEMRALSLLTDPIIRTQRQLDLLCTLIGRLGETAAFRERYFGNAKPQGIRILYTEGDALPNGAFLERDDENRVWAVIPQDRTIGANTTTELVGLPKYNADGQPAGQETPMVHVVDPVDPTPYINAAEATRRRILRMCSQGHMATTNTAESSGLAYEQARATFEKDLDKRRVSEEGMLRYILTTALYLAENISGQTGHFTSKLRVTVDQHVDAGPISPDQQRAFMEARDRNLLSDETTMSRMGVEDTVNERKRILASTSYILSLLEKISKMEKLDLDSLVSVLNLPKEIHAAPVPEPLPPSNDA